MFREAHLVNMLIHLCWNKCYSSGELLFHSSCLLLKQGIIHHPQTYMYPAMKKSELRAPLEQTTLLGSINRGSRRENSGMEEEEIVLSFAPFRVSASLVRLQFNFISIPIVR